MKKVTFSGRPPGSSRPSNADAFVSGSDTPHREASKRFTIDVPVSLHKRVKSQCALENLVMADVMRELLEQRFPLLSEPKRDVAS